MPATISPNVSLALRLLSNGRKLAARVCDAGWDMLAMIPKRPVATRVHSGPKIGVLADVPGIGERLGAPWLGVACGHCPYCLHAAENLCDEPQFAGSTRDGGFADVAIVRADYVFPCLNPMTTTRPMPGGSLFNGRQQTLGTAESGGLRTLAQADVVAPPPPVHTA
jgi:hypothetical protein